MTVTSADIVALTLRAATFAAILLAAGVPLFLGLHGRELRRSLQPIAAFGTRAALAGLVLTAAQQLIEPARLAGSLRGVIDPTLQAMMLESGAGAATAARLVGLALLAIGLRTWRRLASVPALFGTAAVVASFTLMGHTTSHEPRWALASLLLAHVAVIAFWFGALVPLRIAIAVEEPSVAARIVARFSLWATWLVPTIVVAGALLAALLLPTVRSLGSPFGLALAAKLVGYLVLLALGAANKWWLAPRFASGAVAAARGLRQTLAAEWALIVVVLAITAVLTGLFAPGE